MARSRKERYVAKTLLKGDGSQRHAHLGMVDAAGCFMLMLDDGAVCRLRFSGEADLVGRQADEIARLEAEGGALRAEAARLRSIAEDMWAELSRAKRGHYAGRMEELGMEVGK